MVYLDIVSGFLGAGKTTFVNMLLDLYMKMGEKPVYIVNEYGEAALDSRIVGEEGFDTVELTNGCICCTLRGEIEHTVLDIIKELNPTRIVFEPSGVFQFGSFMEVMQKPQMAQACRLGRVITVVDSINYNSARLVYGDFISDQIENAPVVFLSKLDIVGQDIDVSEIICDVMNINENATVVAKPYSELTESTLRGILVSGGGQQQGAGCGGCGHHGEAEGCGHHHGQHDGEGACGHHGNHDGGAACGGHHGEGGHSCPHGHHGEHAGHGPHHEEHEHEHEHSGPVLHEEFDTVTVPAKKDFTQQEADALVADIRSGKYGDVIRAKGILVREGKFLLLNTTFEEAELRPFPCKGEPTVTFIGKNLNRTAIEEHFVI